MTFSFTDYCASLTQHSQYENLRAEKQHKFFFIFRLLGYANEVGEAFRALVSVKFVIGTYGVASAYVLADTYDKASKVSIYFKLEEKKCKIKVQ